MVFKNTLSFLLISGAVFRLQRYSARALLHIFPVLNLKRPFSVLFDFQLFCLLDALQCPEKAKSGSGAFFSAVLPVNSDHFSFAVLLSLSLELTSIFFFTELLLQCFTAQNIPNTDCAPLHIKLLLTFKLSTRILYNQTGHEVERDWRHLPHLRLHSRDTIYIVLV